MRFKEFYLAEEKQIVQLADTYGKVIKQLGVVDSEDYATKNYIHVTLDRSIIDDPLDLLLNNEKNKILLYLKDDLYAIFKRGLLEANNPKEVLSDFVKRVIAKPFSNINFRSDNSGNFSILDVYNYYNERGKEFIDANVFSDIFNLTKTKTTIQIGRGEIFLSLFTRLRKARVGDVLDGDELVEVKDITGVGARYKSSKYGMKYAKQGIEELKKIKDSAGNFVFESNFFEKLPGKERVSIGEKFLEIVYNKLLNYVDDEKIEEIITSVITALINVSNISANSEQKDILMGLLTRKEDVKKFKSFALSLHMHSVLQNLNTSKTIIIKGEVFYPLIFSNFTDVYNYVDQNMIFGKGSWGNSSTDCGFILVGKVK